MDTMPGDSVIQNNAKNPLSGLDPADLLKQGAAEDTILGEPTSSFQPPQIEELTPRFPQFEILKLIGKGGMGAVYKVRQKELDRIVALKILPPAIGETSGFAERFAREAKALAKLNHPGIVTIHEFGQTDGLYFILMEFVDGVNLAQLMKTGRVSPREALAIVPQICDALQYAHEQGIVHRDIKPENLLLDRSGRVKVADFGIAKFVAAVCDPLRNSAIPVTENQTLGGKIIGTPAYMAPEQIEHPSDVDHRADIYALGVVFYQMLTGELPGKDFQAPSRKVHIDVRLDEIVLRALEKEPVLRYQTAEEFRTGLDAIENPQLNADDAPVSASESPTGHGKRFSICRIIIGCIVFGLLMGVREEFDTTWIRSAIAGLAAALGYLVAYSRSGHAVGQTAVKKPRPTGTIIAIGCGVFVLLGVILVIFSAVLYFRFTDSMEQEFESMPPKAIIVDDPSPSSEMSEAVMNRVGKEASQKLEESTRATLQLEIDSLAKNWLAWIDGGDYARSWKDAAVFFQKAITAEAWGQALTIFRKPLGAVKSRKIRDMKEEKTLPGAPDGKYWVIQFDASFDAKAEAVETVAFMLEKDGSWKAFSYFIR